MADDPTALTLVPAPFASPEIATTLARVDGDDHLVGLWLHGLAPSTRRAYV